MKESTESRIVRVLCNGKADFLIFCEKVNRIPNLKYTCVFAFNIKLSMRQFRIKNETGYKK